MSNAVSFIAPYKAIQAHVDRAYSVHVMYRPAIKAPRTKAVLPIPAPEPKAEAATIIPATFTVYEAYVLQMGREKRDLSLIMGHAWINRANRDYRRMCRGQVDNSRQHISLQNYREGL